ncbi:MAG: hypothetical protein WBG19_02350 [Thermoplasmata archaeon]
MLGDGPSVPFLATAPLNTRPPRSRRWPLVAAIAGTVGTVLLLSVLIAVPVSQTVAENLTLTNAGGVFGPVSQTLTFPHGGTLDLSWALVSGTTTTVTFSIVTPSGSMAYQSDSSAGSASFQVGDSGPYTFEIYDWFSGTVEVTGRLHYSAPLL